MPSEVFHALAIENNPADAYLLREAFRFCGFPCQLVIVSTHREAWTLLNSQEIDLILTHSGNDLAEVATFVRQLRAHHRLNVTPVVLLSGSYEVNAAYASGVNVFLRKQVDLDNFFEKIKALMYFWVQVAERPTPVSKAMTQGRTTAE